MLCVPAANGKRLHSIRILSNMHDEWHSFMARQIFGCLMKSRTKPYLKTYIGQIAEVHDLV